MYYMDQFVQIGRRTRFIGIGVLTVLIIACGGTTDEVVPAASTSTPEPTVTQTQFMPPTSTALATVVAAEEPTATSQPASEAREVIVLPFEDEAERAVALELKERWGWDTNLNERTIQLT